MELEGISEETLGENLRVRSDSNEILSSPRRESKLMAAAGIDYGRKRRLHSHSIGSFSGSAGDSSRIYQQGDQWFEEKDGKVTLLELVEVKEKMGRMRKAVPFLPLPAAILLCIFNLLLPSTGTFIGVGTLLCGAKCRHEIRSDGIKYGLLAGFLQLILSPLLVGWIFSIYYGMNLVQDALTKRLEQSTTPESTNPTKSDSPEVL